MSMTTIGCAKHDHAACIIDSVAAVDARYEAAGPNLTPARRRVLQILLQENRAIGAYDILDRLRADGLGSQPTVAYCVLDFIVIDGFAHKIEHLNAFTACAHPGQNHGPAFLICRACDALAEAVGARSAVRVAAEDVGFTVERTMVEALGLCPNCQDTPQP
jgi:Fur family zinc uptake transcriptional regulator